MQWLDQEWFSESKKLITHDKWQLFRVLHHLLNLLPNRCVFKGKKVVRCHIYTSLMLYYNLIHGDISLTNWFLKKLTKQTMSSGCHFLILTFWLSCDTCWSLRKFFFINSLKHRFFLMLGQQLLTISKNPCVRTQILGSFFSC